MKNIFSIAIFAFISNFVLKCDYRWKKNEYKNMTWITPGNLFGLTSSSLLFLSKMFTQFIFSNCLHATRKYKHIYSLYADIYTFMDTEIQNAHKHTYTQTVMHCHKHTQNICNIEIRAQL